MAYSDEDLYNMSDDELEKAFREAKADTDSPEVDVVEDLEQPVEDSDYETSSDEEEEVEVDDVVEETEEGEPDEEAEESVEDEAKETEAETEEEEQPVQKRKYKANGREYEFSDDEIFEQFGHVFGQAMDYTRKMQQIKPWRKTIDAIEQAKLSHEDVALAIDVLSGDKEAIAALLRRTGVDALEIDTDNVKYAPKDYGRNDTELAIKEIVDEISGDKEYDTTYDILQNKWDGRSKDAFVENPELIRQLHIDVKSGMFDTIAPIADKLKLYDGGRGSDLDYYKAAAQQYFRDMAQNEARNTRTEQAEAKRSEVSRVKAEEAKREATKSASVKRKAAAPTAKASGAKQVVDYLDTSDEAFDEWYKQIQDSH